MFVRISWLTCSLSCVCKERDKRKEVQELGYTFWSFTGPETRADQRTQDRCTLASRHAVCWLKREIMQLLAHLTGSRRMLSWCESLHLAFSQAHLVETYSWPCLFIRSLSRVDSG